MNVIEIPEITAMSTPEKIVFLEDLWDSIAENDQTVPVSESHIRELDSRFARYGTSSDSLLSLQELQQKITNRT
jgi:putative addiction module component (TIGR02574 family)